MVAIYRERNIRKLIDGLNEIKNKIETTINITLRFKCFSLINDNERIRKRDENRNYYKSDVLFLIRMTGPENASKSKKYREKEI